MAQILVIGVGPYPTEANVSVSGPTIRLRQFVEPMISAGHDVNIVMLESQIRNSVEIKKARRAISLTPKEILEPWKVLRALEMPVIDAVFGVGSMMPVAAAARVAVHLNKPCWIDFFGDPLAEFNAAVSRKGVRFDVVLRDHIWKFVREALNAGDQFSAVSDRQRDGVLGQLVLLGRAVEDAASHRRVHTIPCGVPSSWTNEPFDPPFPEVLMEEGVSTDTPYIFIGGNWTPWLDERTMGKVLARVLAAEPNCNLVIRSGATDPLAERVRRSFFETLGNDAPADRVHELTVNQCGEAELLAYASATMLLDRDIPESYLGSRNRLLSFVRWGLRPIVSPHSEIAIDLLHAGLAATPQTRDDNGYVDLMRQALHGRATKMVELQRRGLEYLKQLTFDRTISAALEWAESPTRWARGPEDGGLIGQWRTRV